MFYKKGLKTQHICSSVLLPDQRKKHEETNVQNSQAIGQNEALAKSHRWKSSRISVFYHVFEYTFVGLYPYFKSDFIWFI